MNKTKLKRAAENAVREILNAYNRRKEPNDLTACNAVAEQHMRALVTDYANAVRAGVDGCVVQNDGCARMNREQSMVEAFHDKFGVPVREVPEFDPWRAELRAALIQEEAGETIAAILAGDMPEIADGLCDLIYVALGCAVEFGINLKPLFDEVHASNMRKENGGNRADGKILKPAGWKPPQMAKLLEAQGWKSE